MNRLLLGVAFFLLVSGFFAPLFADTIVFWERENGNYRRLENVRIQNATIERVTYVQLDENNDPTMRSGNESAAGIKEIIPRFRMSWRTDDGYQRYQEGEYESAIQMLRSAITSSDAENFDIQLCQYHIGLCYFYMGDNQQAIAAFDEYLDEFSQGFYKPFCLLNKGQAFGYMGRTRDSQSTFQELQRLGSRWEQIAKNELADMLFYNTQYADALTLYREVLNAVQNPTAADMPIFHKATLRVGQCCLWTGDIRGATPRFRELCEDDNLTSYDLLAQAFNGLGSCLYASEDYRGARLAFLRVYILYNTNAQELGRALYFAKECFREVADEDSEKYARKLETEFNARFTQMRQQLDTEKQFLQDH